MGMRLVGRVLAVLAAGLLGIGVAGCSPAPEVGDGRLGTEWAVLPTPSVPVPTAGGCTAAEGSFSVAGWTLAFLPGESVDCARPHLSETYHIGTFPPDDETDPTIVPAVGSARFRYAFDVCVEQAEQFLGASHYLSRLTVVPVLPTDRQWAGMARWFRCELVEVAGLDRTIAVRTGSLRGALSGSGGTGAAGPLLPSCADTTLNDTGDQAIAVVFTSCDGLHDVELTGAYLLPDGDYPGGAAVAASTLAGCQAVSAAYLGVGEGDLLRPGTPVVALAADLTELQWSVGVRWAWCFYGSDLQPRTGSIKGLGTVPYGGA